MDLSKFENVKMRVTPEQSERVQKAVFAAGGNWGYMKGVHISHTKAKFLFFYKERFGYEHQLTFSSEESHFDKHANKEVNPETYAAELEAYVEQLEETKRKQEPTERQPVTPVSEREPIESDFDAEKVGAEADEKRLGVTINNHTDAEVTTEKGESGDVVITIKGKKSVDEVGENALKAVKSKYKMTMCGSVRGDWVNPRKADNERQPMAAKILQDAINIMAERGKSYDKDGKAERSMGKVVAMFNTLTGHELTEAQGWKLMVLLKLVRSEQALDKLDNYQDGAAYMALAGESAGCDDE